ncbi:MAG: ornithine carbamoyltransferase [Chloroflexota bacterium]
MKGKDLLSVSDLPGKEIEALILDAVDLKKRGYLTTLSGKSLALLFEKPSLRTRVSFEMAMRQLGGEVIYLSPAEVGLGKREAISDVARVLSRYVDCLALRTFSHDTLEEFARNSAVPVINALSDLEHPCQTLADLLTIYEKKGELHGLTLAYIGDGNNVAHSLMLGSALTGINFRIASPDGYRVKEEILGESREYARENNSEILLLTDPREAVRDADVVYTDVWTSMGQEEEAEIRRKAFTGYQVNESLLDLASPGVIFMHDLPAHYGEEVAEGIFDDPRAVVFDQAENRLHAQKALLAYLLGGLGVSSAR